MLYKSLAIVCLFLVIGCEDAEPDNRDNWEFSPVVESCTDELCYSEAMPLLKPPASDEQATDWLESHADLNIEWPSVGLDVSEHSDFCEAFGWRIPSRDEIDLLYTECVLEQYVNECNFDQHVDNIFDMAIRIEHASDSQYVKFEKTGDTDFVFSARCVKTNV